MRVNENGQYVSDDGFWVWDGAAWIPADGSAAPAATDAATAETTATQTDTATTDEAAHEPVLEAVHEPEPTQEYTAVDYASDTTAADSGFTGGGYTLPDDSGTSASGGLSDGDRVVPHVDNTHPMSPDGRHWWDGEKWIDVSTDATTLHAAGLAEEPAAETAVDTGWQGTDEELPVAEPVASEPEPVQAVQPAQAERQLSPDGMWEWNGTQWVPAEQAAAEPDPQPEPEPVVAEPEPAKAERQLSPDGHWEWDGTAWVPAQQAAVAAVPAGAHVSPDGHWWWDGSQWLPTGR
ncbi:hypothetical protein acdb102_20930 [Acidothermaceae bacterium B102]|nr:hypothetical protein acdb102_20930 [Acidothermaceae bacterium B102]